MTENMPLIMQSIISSPQFSSMVAAAVQNMMGDSSGSCGTAPTTATHAPNGLPSNITAVASSYGNETPGQVVINNLSMGTPTSTECQGRQNFETGWPSDLSPAPGSSGLQGYLTPRTRPYVDRPVRLDQKKLASKPTKGAGKNKDFTVITVLLETVDPDLPQRASKRETMEKSVEGFGEVPIDFSISDGEEDVRIKIYMSHYEMLLGVKCGIQLYFGSERKNCKDIVPFSNPIVPGRELKPYSKIYVGLMLPTADKWPPLFFTSTTKTVTCPKCHDETINLSLIKDHFAICTGIPGQAMNQIPLRASTAQLAIPPQSVQRHVPQPMQQLVPAPSGSMSLRQPFERQNEGSAGQAASTVLQPVSTQLESLDEGLRALVAHRNHLSRLNGPNERNSITFTAGDFINIAVAAIDNAVFMDNIHLLLEVKLEGNEIAGDGPGLHVFSSLFIHFEKEIGFLNELYETPTEISRKLGAGVTQKDVQRRLHAYGIFSGLGILHYGLYPDWILMSIDRLIPTHPFITGLQVLELVSLLKDNLAIRSIFQPENWKWEKLSSCFVMNRQAAPTTTAERAENRAYELFDNYLLHVCGFVGANSQIDSGSNQQQSTSHIEENDFDSQVKHVSEAEFSLEFVSELLGQGFKLAYIANLFHVDYRRLQYQLQKRGTHMPGAHRMSDVELDTKVSQIVEKFPNAGHKMMKGLFTSSGGGAHATRERLRTSLNRIRSVRNDPPRMSPIKRREYYVKGPLTMLHIDGHHKLIKWRFVVHGGIDGFSRLILFLGLSIDNRAATVLDHFLEGVLTYGLPVCVRSDYGLENIGVADMFAAREEEGLVSYITGKSTHNQRIERLWRDAFQGCLEPFYATFSDLERQQMFNPSNNFDIYALHFVAKQLLESTVSDWKEGWNNHPVSTMNNFTPQQLFTSGILKMRLDGGHHAELNQDKSNIDFAAREALIIREFSDAANRRPAVEVPSYGYPLTKEEEALILTQFSPSDVTLSNLKEEFVWFKNMAIQIINNRL